MELRKNIKRPQRYEPELSHHSSSNRPAPSTQHLNPSASRNPPVPFNPNLPSAAFPSLDTSQTGQTTRQNVLDTHQPRLSAPTNSAQTPQTASMARMRGRDGIVYGMGIPRPASYVPPAQEEDEPSREENDDVENPVYVRNMERIEEAGKMTDEDCFMKEMETSDEDENEDESEQFVVAESSKPKLQKWDDLSVAHRLDLMDTMEESYSSRREAQQRLGLKSPQREDIVRLETRRAEIQDAEDANIAALQSEAMSILLNPSTNRRTKLTQSGYRQLLEKHLYQTIKDEDYLTTTSGELAEAKTYLEDYGFKPTMLNHWVDASGCPGPKAGPSNKHPRTPLPLNPRAEPPSSSSSASSTDHPLNTTGEDTAAPHTAAIDVPASSSSMRTSARTPANRPPASGYQAMLSRFQKSADDPSSSSPTHFTNRPASTENQALPSQTTNTPPSTSSPISPAKQHRRKRERSMPVRRIVVFPIGRQERSGIPTNGTPPTLPQTLHKQPKTPTPSPTNHETAPSITMPPPPLPRTSQPSQDWQEQLRAATQAYTPRTPPQAQPTFPTHTSPNLTREVSYSFATASRLPIATSHPQNPISHPPAPVPQTLTTTTNPPPHGRMRPPLIHQPHFTGGPPPKSLAPKPHPQPPASQFSTFHPTLPSRNSHTTSSSEPNIKQENPAPSIPNQQKTEQPPKQKRTYTRWSRAAAKSSTATAAEGGTPASGPAKAVKAQGTRANIKIVRKRSG